MVFRRPKSLSREKWYVPVDLDNGDTQYLHTDGTVRTLIDADEVLFSTEDKALEATENYNRVIRIGGE